MQQVSQDKCETFNYTQSKRLTDPLIDQSKVKLHELIRPLNLIYLGMNFLDLLDEQTTDLLF